MEKVIVCHRILGDNELGCSAIYEIPELECSEIFWGGIGFLIHKSIKIKDNNLISLSDFNNALPINPRIKFDIEDYNFYIVKGHFLLLEKDDHMEIGSVGKYYIESLCKNLSL